jgi:hypothetical protein
MSEGNVQCDHVRGEKEKKKKRKGKKKTVKQIPSDIWK